MTFFKLAVNAMQLIYNTEYEIEDLNNVSIVYKF